MTDYFWLWLLVIVGLGFLLGLTTDRSVRKAAAWALVAVFLWPFLKLGYASFEAERAARAQEIAAEQAALVYEKFCADGAPRPIVHQAIKEERPLVLLVSVSPNDKWPNNLSSAAKIYSALGEKRLICPSRSLLIQDAKPSLGLSELPRRYDICQGGQTERSEAAITLELEIGDQTSAQSISGPFGERILMIKRSLMLRRAGKVIAEDAVFSVEPNFLNFRSRCPFPEQRLAELLTQALSL